MVKSGKTAKDIFASTTATTNTRTAPGRPPKLDESYTKATVVLLDRQILFLDRLCADIREAGIGKGRPVSMSRAEIIRALIDALAESTLNVTTATSEEDLKERFLAAIGSTNSETASPAPEPSESAL